MDLKEFLWVVDGLENSNDPSDWKQSLSTLTFMTTESYGKGLKEALLIPYIKKAVNHSNPEVKKIGMRFLLSLKVFDIITKEEADEKIIAETLYEKYLRENNPGFLNSLRTTFKKLKMEGKLEQFLRELGDGVFSEPIIKELVFQLNYRDPIKIDEALEVIKFLINKLKVKKQPFIPFLNNFIKDLDKRLYLIDKRNIKEALKHKAQEIIEENSK
ncbi:MAG TPA: hypothetical protein PK663_06290 [Spirochaetota bacterium]|nr:hypothetical protein [Spirochaetota bacterium]HPQ49541.1 hypothetical protein [Spirochaetota bacterium]